MYVLSTKNSAKIYFEGVESRPPSWAFVIYPYILKCRHWILGVEL